MDRLLITVMYKNRGRKFFGTICSRTSCSGFLSVSSDQTQTERERELGGKKNPISVKSNMFFLIESISWSWGRRRGTEEELWPHRQNSRSSSVDTYIYTHTRTHTHACVSITVAHAQIRKCSSSNE